MLDLRPPDIRINAVDETTVREIIYDAFFASIGFESRSRFVAEYYRPKSSRYFASGFIDRHELHFATNYKFFKNAQYDISEHDDHSYREWFRAILNSMINSSASIRVGIDVSSMSRSRMAAVVEAAVGVACQTTITVDFIYAIAKYSPPSSQTPITTLAPLPNYGGWPLDANSPTVTIVGLGYEPDKVIGAIEYFEPDGKWAFVPVGNDDRFLREVMKSNTLLHDDIPSDQWLKYKVLEPCNTFMALESLCFGLSQKCRPIIIPFGPKIFTVLCLLVASLNRQVGVWRVSGGVTENPMDRSAQGAVTGISCTFRKTIPNGTSA